VTYETPSPEMGSSTPVNMDGWEVKLFKIITNSLNMTQTYVRTPKSFDANDLSDVVENFKRNEVDIAFGGVEFIEKMDWEGEVDTTSIYFIRRIRWYVPCYFKYPRWSSIYKMFSPQLWVCLILSLVVTSSIISLIARYERAYSKSPDYWAMTKSLTCVWAVVLAVTAPASPHNVSVRAVFLAWIIFSLAVDTIFQTFLTTFLTESGYEPPIRTIDQMLASKIKYGFHPVFEELYNESDEVNSHIILSNRVPCPSTRDCLKWAQDYKNISVILDEVDIEEKLTTLTLIDENSKPVICPLDDGIVVTVNHAMMMRVGDPLLGRINEIIQRVVEAGLFMQWKKWTFDNIKIGSDALRSGTVLEEYYSFTLEHLQPAFYLLLMGYCISTLIFLLELAHHLVIHLRRSAFNKHHG